MNHAQFVGFLIIKSHVWAKTQEETNAESYSLLSSIFSDYLIYSWYLLIQYLIILK